MEGFSIENCTGFVKATMSPSQFFGDGDNECFVDVHRRVGFSRFLWSFPHNKTEIITDVTDMEPEMVARFFPDYNENLFLAFQRAKDIGLSIVYECDVEALRKDIDGPRYDTANVGDAICSIDLYDGMVIQELKDAGERVAAQTPSDGLQREGKIARLLLGDSPLSSIDPVFDYWEEFVKFRMLDDAVEVDITDITEEMGDYIVHAIGAPDSRPKWRDKIAEEIIKVLMSIGIERGHEENACSRGCVCSPSAVIRCRTSLDRRKNEKWSIRMGYSENVAYASLDPVLVSISPALWGPEASFSVFLNDFRGVNHRIGCFTGCTSMLSRKVQLHSLSKMLWFNVCISWDSVRVTNGREDGFGQYSYVASFKMTNSGHVAQDIRAIRAGQYKTPFVSAGTRTFKRINDLE